MPGHSLPFALERNQRILLVDDNPAIHEDYRKIIGASGGAAADIAELEAEIFGDTRSGPRHASYQISSAYQGKEALEMVKAARDRGEPYAMCFMDVRMPPGWNGVETTQHIWREDPDLEVVICTAYSDCGWADIVEQLGETDRLLILKKPFDAMEVQQLAHALTEKWYLRRKSELNLRELTRERDDEARRRKQAEGELRHAQKLEAVGRLASGMAHELNTPLQFAGDNAVFLADAVKSLTAIVDAYREALAAANPPAELKRRVEDAEAQADLDFLRDQLPQAVEDLEQGLKRVATTVKALRGFSSVDHADLGYVDLNSALRDTLTVAEHDLRDVAFVDIDLRSLPLILCRPGDLNQVFYALINNAANAMADAKKVTGSMGRLRVTTRPDVDHVIVEIGDSGVGIRDDVREHIFEPFFTTREVGKGAGLGLSVAHSIIKGHAGTISFESAPGKGTTFKLRLPLRPPALVSEQQPTALDEVA